MYYELSEKTQSPLERRFLADCVSIGLVVEPQYSVGPIHADFAIPEKKIAIECDSEEFHSSEEAQQTDAARDEIYLSHGWKVLRIRGSGIYKNGERIAEEIKSGMYDSPGVGVIYILDSWYDEEDEDDYL